MMVTVNHGVSLDYADVADGEEIHPQHYAFLVSEDEFDAIYGRIRSWAWTIGPIRGAHDPARSTTTTAAAACTSWIPPATTWKSSPGPTDPALVDPRGQHLDAVAAQCGQPRGGCLARRPARRRASDRPAPLAVRPVGVGGHQPQSTAVAECRNERIRHGHLGVQHRDPPPCDGSRSSAKRMSSSWEYPNVEALSGVAIRVGRKDFDRGLRMLLDGIAARGGPKRRC